jgi:Fe-S-cluster containining protein
MHENVTVFVEDGDWYVQYQTRCKNLRADNTCAIYETRPQICEDYKADGCDYQGGEYGYDHFFTHAKQIEEFYKQKKGIELGVREQQTAKKRGKKRPRGKSA